MEIIKPKEGFCPVCGSDNVDAAGPDSINEVNDTAFKKIIAKRMMCNNCGIYFSEVYSVNLLEQVVDNN